MSKRKRRRKHRTPVAPKRPPGPTPKQYSLTSAITRLNRFLGVIVGLPLLYITYDLPNMMNKGSGLLVVCLILMMAVVGIKFPLNLKARALARGAGPYVDQKAHLQFRWYVVWLLTLSFFSNVIVLMPILYVRGYVTRAAALLPGREQIGTEVSLTVAFLAGAIVSGVLGNLSYDLLKFFYRKVRE